MPPPIRKREQEEDERLLVSRLPVVTLTLCAVNGVLWLVAALLGGGRRVGDLLWGGESLPALIVFGAKINPLIHAGEYWRLITPIFLHLNALHLAVNSYVLLLLGGFIEQLYGRRRLLILYVMAGLCGNLASYLMNPEASVGASTALFGLFGAVIIFWWKHRDAMAPPFRQRMGNQLFMLLFLNLMLGAVFPFIDNWGHIGGLLGGMGIAVMTESRLAGEAARAREWLPMPLALATAGGLLLYGGLGMARNVWQQRPLLLAQVAPSRGDTARAVEALRRSVEQHPEVAELRLQLAQTLIRAGRWEEAASVLEEALRRRPGDLRLLRALLGARLNARNWEGAAELYERLLRRFPDDPVLLGGQAHVFMRLQRWEAAERNYRRLLRDRPNDPVLLNNLAYLYADGLNRNLEEALEMARRATEAAPKNGVFWDTLAWVYYRLGKLDDAYAAQREAVLMAPQEPESQAEIRYHMGAILEARGDRAGAEKEYREALRLDPGLEKAAASLRRLRREGGMAVSPSAG